MQSSIEDHQGLKIITMKLKTIFLAASAASALGIYAFTGNSGRKTSTNLDLPVESKTTPVTKPKIQAAILLDVSGSMDGLIEQAKTQLWNMASVMGRAKCDGVSPELEIALYEYGRSTNDVTKGFIKQITPLTTDLNLLSKELFSLKTDGGDEYCGHVIHTSLQELKWDTDASTYKVIFIAGNEDFRQGNISFTKACEEAKKKGVIVNTIYCGEKQQGINEHWLLAGECGNGSFTHIDHNAEEREIPTPYDSTIFALNNSLNGTYVYYGAFGSEKMEEQSAVDKMNYEKNKTAAAKRVEVKSKGGIYKNSSWDLVDAYNDDKAVIKKVDKKTLPVQLKGKTDDEIEKYVSTKAAERENVRKQIGEINVKRQAYIKQEKAKLSDTPTTLETEIERIIRQQAQKFRMKIEDQ